MPKLIVLENPPSSSPEPFDLLRVVDLFWKVLFSGCINFINTQSTYNFSQKVNTDKTDIQNQLYKFLRIENVCLKLELC